MLAEQRTNVILSELAERGVVSAADLCRVTGASEATIRRDLNALDKKRRLNKVHGGAILIEEAFHVMEPDMEVKRRLCTKEKDRIARYAVSLIGDNDVVHMDAGSSVLQTVQRLQSTRAMFVTNNIECAFRLMENRDYTEVKEV